MKLTTLDSNSEHHVHSNQFCQNCKINLIELKTREPYEYLSGIYRHSEESKNGKVACEWNRISITRYLIYQKNNDGILRDWVITTE